ncbi:MAG: hypothetical protein IJM45_04600 [Clostridia bacterium]|nr:hypothetical protein [Clostridia bacterium]
MKNENELVRATRKADILSRVHSAVKLVDKIAQEDADVKSENAIKESRKATDDLGAIMSEARIDALIKDSGAGKRKDYARRWITSINPTDFINLTTGKTQDRSVFDRMPGERGSTVDEYDYVQGLKGRYQVEQTVGKKQWTRRRKKSKIQEERILLQRGRDQLSDLGKQQKHACRIVIQEGKPKQYDLLHNVRRRQSATDNTSAIQ